MNNDEPIPSFNEGLPSMDTDSSIRVIKREELEKAKDKSVHLREAIKVKKKKFVCEGLDPDCSFDTDYKAAYANHIKTHKPDMLELYAGDIIQIWQPFGAGSLIWDADKQLYVSPNHIKIPEGYRLHKMTGNTKSLGIPDRTHDGALRSISFTEVIIMKDGVEEK